MLSFLLVMFPIMIGVVTLISRGIVSFQVGTVILLASVLAAERLLRRPGILSLVGASLTIYLFATTQGRDTTLKLVTALFILYGLFLMLRGPFIRK
jgi:hypothetical protein